MWVSSFFNKSIMVSAIIFGDLLLTFDRTIETFVDTSKSILGGVESTLIPFNFSGRINNLFFSAFFIIVNTLSLYSSNIFILMIYKYLLQIDQSFQKYSQL